MIKMLLFALAMLNATIALAADPFARAAVEKEDGGIVPGEQVRVNVDVFTPSFFTSPPQFPLFDLPNALVTLPAERSENLSLTIDGVQYSGIRKSYAVVPQISGEFSLPEFDIELSYSQNGHSTKATVKVPTVSFVVDGPPSGERSVAFAATNLTLEQSFDRDARSLTVGDALTRTITVTAQDTQAMLIPPVLVGSVQGIRQYKRSPTIEDGIGAGRDTASRRTETYVYTAEADGSFVVPAISISWFDTESRKTRTSSLPPVAVTVLPHKAAPGIKPVVDDAAAPPPHVDRQRIAIGIFTLLTVVALAWIGRAAMPYVRNRIAVAWHSYHTSHRYRLELLRKTILSGSNAEIYAALQNWSRSLGHRTIGDWLQGAPADLQVQVDLLSAELFGSAGGHVDRRKLASVVNYLKECTNVEISALPPLNP